MTEPTPSLDALVAALLADPPRSVDAEALAAADQGALAAALRGAVADLPVAEQRTKLAAAFRAMSIDDPGAAGTVPGTGSAPTIPANPPMVASHRSLLTVRSFTPARIGALAGILLVSVLGGVALGAVAAGDGTAVDPLAAMDLPVPVLTPVAAGDEAPSTDHVNGLLPPDPAVQADGVRDAIDNNADELGDDIADLDLGAVTDATGDVVVEQVGGFADGAAVFGTSDATTTGPGPDEESSALADICAIDDPAADCEGVGGTVSLAIVEPFRFNYDPTLWTGWPSCIALGRDLEPDEFVIQLETNNLGSFTARFRIAGSGDPFTEVTGSTPAEWREALDIGAVLQAVTCLVADRPGDAGPQRLEVDIDGVGAESSGTARFVGELDLDPAPLPAPPDPVAAARAGRPAVRVEALNAATLRVTVPVGRSGEAAEVRLVPRDPEGTGGECADDAVRAVARGEEAEASVRRVDEIIITDWVDRRFDVTAPEPGSYSLCVDWLDDFEPPRNLERAAIPVEINAVPQVEVLVAGFEPGRAPGRQPSEIGIAGLERGEACGGTTLRAADLTGRADRTDPDVICALRTIPAYVGLQTLPDFGGEEPLIQRALVPVPECTTEPVCTTWYLKTILDPDRASSGAVVVGVRVTGSDGPGSVTIGDEIPEFTTDSAIDGPRLDWSQVSVVPDAAAPARRVIAHWASDVPAAVAVTATTDGSYDGCEPVRVPRGAPATAGDITIDGLCPAVSYYVSFDLEGDVGRTVYDVWNRLFLPDSAQRVYRSATVTPDPMTVEFDYELSFEETFRGDPVGKGVVPERIWITFPRSWTGGETHEYQYSQYYDGRARFELDCANPAGFNRSGSGVALDLHGGTFSLSESSVSFSTYSPVQRGIFDGGPGRRCPSLYNQANQTATISECPARITALDPVGTTNRIDAMLAGEPAVFRASVPMCDNTIHRFTATVTVRMREVRTLRGT